jgi:hypothetical protein
LRSVSECSIWSVPMGLLCCIIVYQLGLSCNTTN